MDDAYARLAAALDRLANGFPRTTSSVELQVLGKMFSPDEAALAAVLTATPESAAAIAERADLGVDRVAGLLAELAERGLLWQLDKGEAARYRLAPFIIGSFEMHMLTTRDEEFARLVEEYLTGGGAAAIMSPQPAIHRVVPARSALKSEWILPYEDVRAILLGARSVRIVDCVCRLQQDKLGRRRCDFPLTSCMWFSSSEAAPAEGTVSSAQALAFLDEVEEIGLVHTVSNVMQGVGYICNCCGCCCGLLRGITEWGIEHSVAQADYYAAIDADACTACGACSDRCQVGAIAEHEGVYVVDRPRCIGCGLCVTGCTARAAELHPKAEDEIVAPPADFAAWQRARLQSRGLL
jgi:Pyruvate/2-oxoacid:ferredoxin oxidoreductase delta subunit